MKVYDIIAYSFTEDQTPPTFLESDRTTFIFCVATRPWMLWLKKLHTPRIRYSFTFQEVEQAWLRWSFPNIKYCVYRLRFQRCRYRHCECWFFRRCFVRVCDTRKRGVHTHCRFAVLLLLKGWSEYRTYSYDEEREYDIRLLSCWRELTWVVLLSNGVCLFKAYVALSPLVCLLTTRLSKWLDESCVFGLIVADVPGLLLICVAKADA